jgi:hypothetical protein
MPRAGRRSSWCPRRRKPAPGGLADARIRFSRTRRRLLRVAATERQSSCPRPKRPCSTTTPRALRSAPLSDQTRRTCASKVRQFLARLASVGLDGDPLTSADGRDWAVRHYRTHLPAVLKRSPTTVNKALAAVDDFYIRHGLGPASAARVEIPAVARGRSTNAPSSATSEPFNAGPRRVTRRSRSSLATPAPGPAKSLPSTSTTSPAPPAKASCGSTARANASGRSRSARSCTPRSPAG